MTNQGGAFKTQSPATKGNSSERRTAPSNSRIVSIDAISAHAKQTHRPPEDGNDNAGSAKNDPADVASNTDNINQDVPITGRARTAIVARIRCPKFVGAT